MSMLEIGNNIRRIREIKNYTQEAVAGMVGMSVTAYGDIERGKSDVNFTRLEEIAAALEVKPEEIVNFGNTTHNNTFQSNNGTGIVYANGDANIASGEKELYERMLKEKNEEITFLREQLRKG